jgi:hypothetical protein
MFPTEIGIFRGRNAPQGGNDAYPGQLSAEQTITEGDRNFLTD